MNEAETRAELIDPKLLAAGWGAIEGTKVLREFQIAAGKIQTGGMRAEPLITDYVLVYHNRKLAVIVAKSDEEEVGEGVAQARNYAGKLQLEMTFACNGKEIFRCVSRRARGIGPKPVGERFDTAAANWMILREHCSPMTSEEFETKYTLILGWIHNTLAEHESAAQSVASLGFQRLPHYFSPDELASAKVVYISTVPAPPLAAIGLPQFSDFENMNAGGVTYLNTFFSRPEMRGNESHHFHELIHMVQWRLLGPKSFVAAYADGLERIGYRHSPLEVMAYTLESIFKNSTTPFDVATVVRDQLAALYEIQ